MDLVEELDDPAIPVATACAALDVSRATLYRNTRPPSPPRVAQRAPSPRRISDADWCREIAGTRVHGTTRQIPRELFESVEKPAIPSGRFFPSAFGMYRRSTAAGRYVPARNAELMPSRKTSVPSCSTSAVV